MNESLLPCSPFHNEDWIEELSESYEGPNDPQEPEDTDDSTITITCNIPTI